MIPYNWLMEAAHRIAPHILRTPLTYDPHNDLYLKWENHQVTGSFKARGALNKVLNLQMWERERGLVTASAGNHGQGVALAGRLVGAPVTIFASEHAIPAKVTAMRQLGADVRLVPGGYGEAESAGLAYASQREATWVSPYNDGQVIAGQGTLAVEVLEQEPVAQGATWVVPVGGGGLAAGIGVAVKEAPLERGGDSRPVLIGVQSEASPFFHAIFHRGTQQDVVDRPSLADGLAGSVEERSLTIPLLRRYMDDLILVTETDIAAAIALAWEQYGQRIEGSAAAALAAVFTGRVAARPAVVILSGGNIQPEIHAGILREYQATKRKE